MSVSKIVIIGGGIAGLCSAFELKKLNPKLDITIVESRKVGSGSTEKAAGLLTPATEIHHKDDSYLKSVLDSLEYYPEFVKELTHNNSEKVGFQNQGNLLCAFENDGERELERLIDFKTTMGLKVVELNASELKTKEPYFSQKIQRAFYAPHEGAVNPLELVKFLAEELMASGCKILENTSVSDVEITNETITNLTLSNKSVLTCDHVILASGVSHNIAKLKAMFPVPLRPVKGEALLLKFPEQILNHPVQVYHRYPVYLCPRQNGQIVVGATSEEKSDTQVTAGGVLDLLFSAWQVLPEIYEHQLVKTWAGLRPTTPDNYPIAGATNLKNMSCLLGLYRKGILLAPYLAKQLALQILDQNSQLNWDLFRYDRF